MEGKITCFTVSGPQATFDLLLFGQGRSRLQRIIKPADGSPPGDRWDKELGLAWRALCPICSRRCGPIHREPDGPLHPGAI